MASITQDYKVPSISYPLRQKYGVTKATIFQVRLKQLGIQHKLIKPFTPRHNGKVGHSHRKDNERF